MPTLPGHHREGARRRAGNLVLPSLPVVALVAYATSMLATEFACSQCGREAPTDREELAAWRHGEVALEGEIGEGLLLCPDCDAEDRDRAFEEGEGG